MRKNTLINIALVFLILGAIGIYVAIWTVVPDRNFTTAGQVGLTAALTLVIGIVLLIAASDMRQDKK